MSQTRIFARHLDSTRQVLVYEMTLLTDRDVAMVLPIPVPPRSGEDTVSFVDLSDYPDFFDDLEDGFPELRVPGDAPASRDLSIFPQQTLVVHDVGDFEASFVPAVEDFDRLDARFRLPDGVWAQLPDYADYGFAVFKLKPTHRSWLQRLFRPPEPRKIHPMAFIFPSRDPDHLFFPTVHIHDGEVHAEARYDHMLYGQLPVDQEPQDLCTLDRFLRWQASTRPAGDYMKVHKAQGLIDAADVCFRAGVSGMHRNTDLRLRSRRRRDESLIAELVTAIGGPANAAQNMTRLQNADYPAWADKSTLQLAILKLWHQGEDSLEALLAVPHPALNQLQSRALRPRTLAVPYHNLNPQQQLSIDKDDADEVHAWIAALR